MPLNSQSLRQMGHFCSACDPSHLLMHWRWKAWVHCPHTTGLSSPGNWASGGHASYGARQIPHTSSPASQVQHPTALHFVTCTSKLITPLCSHPCRPFSSSCAPYVRPRCASHVSFACISNLAVPSHVPLRTSATGSRRRIFPRIHPNRNPQVFGLFGNRGQFPFRKESSTGSHRRP